MSYIFSVNNTPATGAIAMYQLISTLITAGWTKVMDSDGTIYSASGAQVTSGNTGYTGLDNSNAWIRLRAPAVLKGGAVANQTREITFQRGTTQVAWRVKYSASAGFSGGSPATTVTPSSTDEVFMLGGGTDASPTFNSWFSTLNTYNWHIIAGGSDEYYSFAAWAMAKGQTASSGNMIALDVMALGSYPSIDVDPAVMFCSTAGTSSTTDLTSALFAASTVTNPSLARAWFGSTSAAGAAVTGTNNVNVQMITYGSGTIGNSGTLGTNPWTNDDDLLPCLWGNAATLGPRGIKGFSTLFLVGSVNRKNMDTCDFSYTGAKDKVYFNQFWLPWSGVTPAI